MDGAISEQYSSVRVVLKSLSGIILKHAIKITFSPDINQVEHEAIITGLKFALGLGVLDIKEFSDT